MFQRKRRLDCSSLVRISCTLAFSKIRQINYLLLNFLSYSPADDVKGYKVHGVTVSEIELDVLTGEKIVKTCNFFKLKISRIVMGKTV